MQKEWIINCSKKTGYYSALHKCEALNRIYYGKYLQSKSLSQEENDSSSSNEGENSSNRLDSFGNRNTSFTGYSGYKNLAVKK